MKGSKDPRDLRNIFFKTFSKENDFEHMNFETEKVKPESSCKKAPPDTPPPHQLVFFTYP